MINEKQKRIAMEQGWTIEESIDGIVLVLNGDLRHTKNVEFFRIASYIGVTRLWMEEEDGYNLVETICRYRRTYGYGDAFINNILDEDECQNVIQLREYKINYIDILDGLVEYDNKIDELFQAITELID